MSDAAIAGALTIAQSAQAQAPAQMPNLPAAKKAAKEYESVFISEFLGSMFQDMPTDGPFGGGQGEAMFRSLMLDEYGKQMESRGGFGLSDAITRTLLAHQEAAAS